MLGWFRAHMPKEERGLVSRAGRGENDTQKMLVDMPAPPPGQTKGGGGPRAPLSIAPTRRFG